MQPTTCNLQSPTYYLLPATYSTTYYLLPTIPTIIPTTVPTTHYLLPNTYYLLPSTYYLLPTTCYLMPTVMPNTYYLGVLEGSPQGFDTYKLATRMRAISGTIATHFVQVHSASVSVRLSLQPTTLTTAPLSLFGALKIESAGFSTGNCVALMPSTPLLAPVYFFRETQAALGFLSHLSFSARRFPFTAYLGLRTGPRRVCET